MSDVQTEPPTNTKIHKELLLKASQFRENSAKEIEATGFINYVSFALMNEIHGIEVENLREILKAIAITRVPGCSSFLNGIINLRGNLITVVDLKSCLGMQSSKQTDLSRIMIVQNEHRLIGLLVDKVIEIVRINESDITAPSKGMTEADVTYIKNIAHANGQVVVIPNLDAIFKTLI